MNSLNPNRYLEEPIDLEHKQYVLLSYLQDVDRDFVDNKSEPYFSNLKFHVQNIDCFVTKRTVLEPKDQVLTAEQNQRLSYVLDMPDGSDEMREARAICRWASPLLKNKLREGKKIFGTKQQKRLTAGT